MKPKGDDGMNEKMEQIRRAVKAGKLTADGARKALEDEMERELSQKPEDIDMDVVNACEALLTELSGADEALHTVGLANKAGQDYLTLSGGEKQLCILARTIAEDAPLLLLDEPDSALDLANRSRMTALLAQLVHTGGKTALVCLHDPALALDSCDLPAVLPGGEAAAVLHPRTDPPAGRQAALAAVYGPLELLPVTDCRGRRRLALLPL